MAILCHYQLSLEGWACGRPNSGGDTTEHWEMLEKSLSPLLLNPPRPFICPVMEERDAGIDKVRVYLIVKAMNSLLPAR
jgi:hypothetical protein